MNTNAPILSARRFIGMGAVVAACATLIVPVEAKDHEVTVAYHVSTQGLDLGQPDGARQLYARLEHAARIVCTHGMRVDLQASPDPEGCYEVTLADVIRSANLPLLTQVYLAKHELRSAAAAHGIDAPVKMAAK